MKTVKVGTTITLGEGIPKICVPITAENNGDLSVQVRQAAACEDADLIEWRADWYRSIQEEGAVFNTLTYLKKELGQKPILFTFRRAEEGGETQISLKNYASLIEQAIKAGTHAVDLELSIGDDLLKELLQKVHKAKIPAIVSSHDFEKTPSVEEMISRLEHMYVLGADVCKLAVMPKNAGDTLRLLEATFRQKEKYPDCLLITMSMSKLGVISRICGESFGSAMTFGTVGRASAPGQLEARELKKILLALH